MHGKVLLPRNFLRGDPFVAFEFELYFAFGMRCAALLAGRS